MNFDECSFVDLVRALLLCHDFYNVDDEFKEYVDVCVSSGLMRILELVKKRTTPVFQFVPPNSDK